MRTPVQKPFIGAVAFNRITRARGPLGGQPILYGWQWAGVDDLYTWVSEWLR